jgi:hypothetical protein
MGYYIRVFGKQDPDIHLDNLLKGLEAEGLSAQLCIAKGDEPGCWTTLQVRNSYGDIISQIERNPVVDGQLGKDELDEFRDELDDGKPDSAAKWLRNYFLDVKVIYAFQLLNLAFEDANFPIISCLEATIWNATSGILQADHEGFSNEDGYHILWQFSNDVTGEWACATMGTDGNWNRFLMDLGDQTQRQEFIDGNVPAMAKRL